MTFTKYACWSEDRVSVVMNTDAETVAADVFLAVHTEHDLIMVDPGVRGSEQQWSARRRWTMGAADFLRAFLSPASLQLHVAVRGESGSGKSHFIRWLALNLPHRDDLFALSIPRTGTNLRGVLERIISILPVERALKYQQALNMAGYSNAPREQRRERLLSEIALSIQALQPATDSSTAEVEQWLIEGLPNLFNDPHYRSRLSQPGGIIEQLVNHISETPLIYERREERHAFRSEDLPLTGLEIVNLSREAGDFLVMLLNNQEWVSLAVTIINNSLSVAISGVLNFQGDRLIELMLDVRRYLRHEGKSLILLIEDFARLQGVDTALLQALIEPSSEGSDGLCELRWAMAVTGGYYEQLPDTVKSRMDFLIDMDLPTEGELAVLGSDSVLPFATRYLNAVRLSANQLAAWYQVVTTSSEPPLVPNRCEECNFRDECHTSFGAVDGVGLYPFNQAALSTMAERQDPDIHSRFNPRRFIKRVLADVTSTYWREIAAGDFPDARLLRMMGGSRLAPALEEQLKHDNPVDFERYRTLLELWGVPGTPIRLHEGIYTAFGLRPPKLPGVPASAVLRPESTRVLNPPVPVIAERVDPTVQAIRQWAQGGSMSEQAANALREHIYTALEGYIDWDAVGLERKSFMMRIGTASVPFARKNIVFRNQQTQAPVSGVRLQLPLDPDNMDELRRTAIAFEAMWQFQMQKSWDFPNGFQGLVAVGECLARWSAALLKEFKRWSGGDKWDAVAQAVEVLAVGAALGGRLSGTQITSTDALNALFEPWPEALSEQTTKEWQGLYHAIRKQADDMRAILRAWAFATKGGQTRAMLDPSAIFLPLKRILRDWKLTTTTLDVTSLRGSYQALASLHERVQTQLPAAVAAEYDRRMAWLDGVRQYMDSSTSRAEVVKAAQQLREAIANQGLGVRQMVLNSFDEALVMFKAVQLDAAIRTAEQLRDSLNPRAELQRLPLDRAASSMTAADRFFSAADDLLSEAEAALATKRQMLDVQVSEQLRGDLETIDRSLREIEDSLRAIGGESC